MPSEWRHCETEKGKQDLFYYDSEEVLKIIGIPKTLMRFGGDSKKWQIRRVFHF